ncbi:bifunctional aminoacyl-tRNA synthetase [Roseibium sp. TrichSKD4]|nr:bifunctional aminoacyl-tRNA synthetase [Roseibium sp. TrichSKD4]
MSAERELVRTFGESSNRFEEVFDELSRWEEVLKGTSLGQKPPSP